MTIGDLIWLPQLSLALLIFSQNRDISLTYFSNISKNGRVDRSDYLAPTKLI